MSRLIFSRDMVYEAIHRNRKLLPIQEFKLQKTWLPWRELCEIYAEPAGAVFVSCGAAGDALTYTRHGSFVQDVPVDISFRVGIKNFNDIEEVDKYVHFLEKLWWLCGNAPRLLNVSDYGPTRIEPLKDPQGTPTSYTLQKEANVFESYFTVHYRTIMGE